MYLEDVALTYFQKNGLTMSETYFDDSNIMEPSSRNMLNKLITDIRKEIGRAHV